MSKNFLQLSFFGAVIGILAFLPLFGVFAAAPFTDNFDTRTLNASIIGQGNWTGADNGNFLVKDDDCVSGRCVVDMAGGSYYAILDGTDLMVGQFSFALKLPPQASGHSKIYVGSSLQVYFSEFTTGMGFFDLKQTASGGTVMIKTNIPFNTWFSITCQFEAYDGNTKSHIKCKYNNEEYGAWNDMLHEPLGELWWTGQDAGDRIDNIQESSYTPPVYDVNIVSPTSGSTMTAEFTMTATYTNAEGYDRLMILFDELDASSTCPVGTGSFPYFSPYFSTSTGTTTVAVDNLIARNFDCVRCYFINETSGAMSEPQCPTYTINIATFILPSGYPSFTFPIQSWPAYYASSTDKWATSTALFTGWADTLQPMTQWIGNLSLTFKEMFNASTSEAFGRQYGEAIPKARGYLAVINNFFAGLPVGEIYIFYLLTALVIIVFKMISAIIHLIKP